MSIEDQISNYYEHKVVEEIYRVTNNLPMDQLADIACVALNRLPPKYFRYEVDMAFYISTSEASDMADKVKEAVSFAVTFVMQRGR